MTREEQIKAASSAYTKVRCPMVIGGERFNNKINSINANFVAGAKWADNNPKSPWISVKERLPEPEKEVIILDKRKRIDIDFLTDDGDGGYYWWKSEDAIFSENDEITHWMPIPQLPKEDRK
jgi:hypothetical protein